MTLRAPQQQASPSGASHQRGHMKVAGRLPQMAWIQKSKSTTHHPHPTPTTLVSSIDGPELVCLQLRPTGCHDLSLHIGFNLSIQVGTD